jgi:hypothetical protein
VDDFETIEGNAILQDKYLGFMVIRPTYQNLIGRSVISPQALKKNHFLSISAKVNSSVNFIKFSVEGFSSFITRYRNYYLC